MSRVITLAWAGFAVVFRRVRQPPGLARRSGEVLGSLFYGTILGNLPDAFYVRHVGGTAVFVGALVAEAAVLACFRFTKISFLWYTWSAAPSLVLVRWPCRRLMRARACQGLERRRWLRSWIRTPHDEQVTR